MSDNDIQEFRKAIAERNRVFELINAQLIDPDARYGASAHIANYAEAALDALDELNAIVAALVDLLIEREPGYDSVKWRCLGCLNVGAEPQSIAHTPDCPVGRALARVGKAANE